MSIAQDVEQVRKGRYVVYTNVGTTVFDVLRDEVPLNLILEIDKQGKALCVAHDEDTASLHVYEDHVHCYGCGFHGDVVNVWQAKKSIRSSLEAARDLAREFEVALPEMSSEGWERLSQHRGEQELHLATAKEANGRLVRKKKVREWWESRGFGPDLRERFILGASADGKAAVIPMHHRGRVLGLIYRNLSGKTKYLLPPQEELPGGYKPLFIPAPLMGQIFLVEGYVDALTIAATGKSAIAVGGTSISDEQLRDLKRLLVRGGKLYVLCDDDDAGAEAARQWSRTLYPVTMTCPRDFEQDAKDIADTFARIGVDETSVHLDRLIDVAQDPVDAETAILNAKVKDGFTPRQQLTYALQNIVPLLARLEPEAMRLAVRDMIIKDNALEKQWMNNAMKEEKLRVESEFMEQMDAESRRRAEAEHEAYLAEVEKAQPEIDDRLAPGVLQRLRKVAAALNKVEGDDKALELALLVALGAQLDPLPNGRPMGASILLTAVAGRGKNYIVDAACKALPEDFYYAFEIASGQSFYYRVETDPDFLKHTFLYPNEIEGAEALWEFLRPMLSKGSAEKQVTAKDPMGNMTVKIIKVKGPVTLAIPTIRNKTDEQMQSRLLVAELPDYTGRVKRHSAAHSRLFRSSAYAEVDYERETWIWQEALLQLTQIRKVVFDLPHPDFALDDDQLSHGARTWANLLSLMATHAWLEQKNRQTLDVGDDTLVIQSTPQDYEVAYDIFKDVCKRSIVNLSDVHRRILQALYDLHRENPDRQGFVFREIAKRAKVSISTLSDNKTFLVTSAKFLREGEMGLALVEGAEPAWWEDEDLTKGLPTPDKVRAWWDEQWSLPAAKVPNSRTKGGGASPKADRQGDSGVRPPAEHAPNVFGDGTPAERVRPLFGEQPNAQNGIDKPDSPSTEGDVRLFGGFNALTASILDGLLGEFGRPVFGSEDEEDEDPEVAEHAEHAEQTSRPTTVVNVHSGQPYDEYGGRGPGGTVPKSGRGMWGNPFIEGLDGTRDEVIEMYDRYLDGPVANYKGEVFDGRHLRPLIPSLRGKVIGCHCKPKPCHCDVLAERADRDVRLVRALSGWCPGGAGQRNPLGKPKSSCGDPRVRVSGVSGGFSGGEKNSRLRGRPADVVSNKIGWDAQEGRWVFDPGRALPRENPDGRRFADVD